mmetsp:Transcript_154921/g.495373  ORF Transcript_154921/g.495373 Transcript_154921/m.495373 type:complete len:696 (+) Transcript_154921:61-2148(+)
MLSAPSMAFSDVEDEDDDEEAFVEAAPAPKRRRASVAIDVDDDAAGDAPTPATGSGSQAPSREAQVAAEAQQRLRAVHGELGQVRHQLAALRAEEARLVAEEGQLAERIAIAKANQSRADVAAQEWSSGFEWDAAVDKELLQVFGHRVTRPLQREALNAVLAGKDAFAVMPTGSGKSLCYQLPAVLWSKDSKGVASQGSVLVISPLLALIHDQVRGMRAKGVDARMLNSDIDKEERKETLNALGAGKVTLVYVTPEFLAKSKMVISKLQHAFKANRFRLIAVDEAHCCSQWGHEFRPDYLKLKILRENFPSVPIIALTATATESVQRDVESQLGIRGCLLLRGRYNRPNLYYAVALKPEKKEDELAWLSNFILERHAGHSGLIYCLSCKDVDHTTEALVARGVRAAAYHSQRLPADRQAAYTRWARGEVHVVVATIAFGMGIDKPDVRFVVHQSLPKSVENYYQESGRAGRDGQPADCILLYRPADVQRLSSMAAENANRERNVGLVYEMLLCVDPPAGSVCRRRALAKYFGDVWRETDCNKLCDACLNAGRAALGCQSDASELAGAVLRTLGAAVGNAAAGGDKLTLLKAVDVVRTDSAPAKRLRGGAPADKALKAASPRDVERVLARLLAEGFLCEEFSFTAYTVNGYLRLTERGYEATFPGAKPPELKLLSVPAVEDLRLPRLFRPADPAAA